MILDVYHGTAIEVPETVDEIEENLLFNNLDEGYSDLGCVFFSENEGVGLHFSKSALGSLSGDGIQCIIKAEIEMDDADVITVGAYQTEYQFSDDEEPLQLAADREELYERLQDEGVSAFIIEDNYPTEGIKANDIALFDTSLYEAQAIKFNLDGKWTHWIRDEELAESVLKKHFFEKKQILVEDKQLDA